MIESLEPIKDVAPFVTPFIPTIIEIFIKPKIQKLAKYLKKSSTDTIVSVEAYFVEYLERSYRKYSFIPIIIFQNKQIKLQDIYIPLTVRRVEDRFQTQGKYELDHEYIFSYTDESSNDGILIDNYPNDFLPRFKKVLVVDTAGMGKSTMMKRLFLACLEEQKGIPVFIELRKLKGDDSIVKLIYNEINPINDEFEEDFILQLIKEGNFIFFLDGYDEISQSERDKVTQNLHSFVSKADKNLFIMTSRPDNALSSFPDFMEFDIKPLELEEAFSLLSKYDNGGVLSSQIIEKLQGETLKNISDFLENPLLVSLLYRSYDYKPTIPLKKHIFYRQVFDALFDSHDLTKQGYIREKYSKLDSDNFHTVLRSLGYLTLKHGIEYDKDQILSFLKQTKIQCATIEFSESKVLEDLLQTVPIFTIEGAKYVWSHKSLQDYFAAQFIWFDSNENKSNILRQMVRSLDKYKYLNVLDLYYDMDYKTFRQILIYDYVSDFVKQFEAPMRLETINTPDEKTIEIIKSLTFGKIYLFIRNVRPKNSSRYVFRVNKDTDSSTTYAKDIDVKSFFAKKGFNFDGYITRNNYYLAFSSNLFEFLNYNGFLHQLLITKEEDLFKRPPILNSKLSIKELKVEFSGFSPNLVIIGGDEKFDKLIEFQFSTITRDSKILDPAKCKAMKREIEEEIKREKSGDIYTNL